MIPITTLQQLIDYTASIKIQKEALQTSTVFTSIEKILLLEIYDKQMKIVTSRIHHLQDLDEAVNA